jgi:polysaccharide deacetylase 2 family uncharacterized protein YibQ
VDVSPPECYAQQLPEDSPRLAIIIDDLGQDSRQVQLLARMRAPLTVAVIPGQACSRETAVEAARARLEVLLHLPMEPLRQPSEPSGFGRIRVGMTGPEVARLMEGAVAEVPGAVGLNNHMGSRATRDRRTMELVLEQARSRGLFFIDSRTTGGSVAFRTARDLRVRAGYRSVFLDAERSRAFVRQQLRQLEAVARREGAAIDIGHPFPETLEALGDLVPELARRGVKLVYASQLVD